MAVEPTDPVFDATETPQDEHTVGGLDNGHPANAEASIVDLLKQDLDELASTDFVHIPVQGYEKTRLSIRYRKPENGKVLDGLANDVMREFKNDYDRNIMIGVDTMIHLCDGLYAQPLGFKEPAPVDPEKSGQPVDFGIRLARLFGWDEGGSNRQNVKKLFDGNELAIAAHSEKLNRWLMNSKADVNREFWQSGN